MLATACPKPRPKKLERDERRAGHKTLEQTEDAKARKRAGGRCECRVLVEGFNAAHTRCYRRDVHTHHLIGGIGRRGRGKSALAINKLRVCEKCHRDITGHVLK